MKNKIILGIILIAMMFCLCGCSSESVAETENRFVKVSNEYYFYVYYDKYTKVMYSIIPNREITPLLNADGTPLLYGGE